MPTKQACRGFTRSATHTSAQHTPYTDNNQKVNEMNSSYLNYHRLFAFLVKCNYVLSTTYDVARVCLPVCPVRLRCLLQEWYSCRSTDFRPDAKCISVTNCSETLEKKTGSENWNVRVHTKTDRIEMASWFFAVLLWNGEIIFSNVFLVFSMHTRVYLLFACASFYVCVYAVCCVWRRACRILYFNVSFLCFVFRIQIKCPTSFWVHITIHTLRCWLCMKCNAPQRPSLTGLFGLEMTQFHYYQTHTQP